MNATLDPSAESAYLFCCSSHEFGSALVSLSLSLRPFFRLPLSHGTFRGLAANELLECIRPSRTLTAVFRSRRCTRERSTHTTHAKYPRGFHWAQKSHAPGFSTARKVPIIRTHSAPEPFNRPTDRPLRSDRTRLRSVSSTSLLRDEAVRHTDKIRELPRTPHSLSPSQRGDSPVRWQQYAAHSTLPSIAIRDTREREATRGSLCEIARDD